MAMVRPHCCVRFWLSMILKGLAMACFFPVRRGLRVARLLCEGRLVEVYPAMTKEAVATIEGSRFQVICS